MFVRGEWGAKLRARDSRHKLARVHFLARTVRQLSLALQVPNPGMHCPASRSSGASELAGDLDSAPNVIRKSDFRGGPWSWKDSNDRIGVESAEGSAGWRDDVLGHDFGDSVMGPNVNV